MASSRCANCIGTLSFPISGARHYVVSCYAEVTPSDPTRLDAFCRVWSAGVNWVSDACRRALFFLTSRHDQRGDIRLFQMAHAAHF